MSSTLDFTTQLAWYLANIEAYAAHDTRIHPVHFLLGVLKLMDLGFEEQLQPGSLSPPQLEELRALAGRCRQFLELSDSDVRQFRRFVRGQICDRPRRLPAEPPLMHRSPESRSLFAVALAKAQREITCQDLLEAIVKSAESGFATNWDAYSRMLRGESDGSGSQHLRISRRLGIEDLSSCIEQQNWAPPIGREQEVLQILGFLHRSRKRSVLLVGGPGVGKRTIVRGLAARLKKMGNEAGSGAPRLLQVNGDAVTWLSEARGDEEQELVDHLRDVLLDRQSLVFISDLHVLFLRDMESEIVGLLLTFLGDGDACVLASTTSEGLEKLSAAGINVSRYFNVLRVKELSTETTAQILEAAAQHIGRVQGVEFTPEALNAVRILSDKNIAGHQPEKGLDLMENAAAFTIVSMLTQSRGSRPKPPLRVSEKDIRKVLEEQYGISP